MARKLGRQGAGSNRSILASKRRELRAQVYEKAKGVCQICFRFMPYEAMSMDHIIPVSAGGKAVLSNLQGTHIKCNRNRGATPLYCLRTTNESSRRL